MTNKYEIVVIGAGPGGLMLAYLMAKAGRKVAILEMTSERKRRVCGEYLCPQGVKLLEGHGILEQLTKGFLPLRGMTISNTSNLQLKTYFPRREGKDWWGLSLNRQIFEEHFLSLCKQLGVAVFEGTSFKQIDQHTASSVVIKCQEGEIFESSLLVGADGRRSKVAQAIGLLPKDRGYLGGRVALHTLVTPQIEMERLGEMHIFSDGSYIGLDPINEKELNVSLVTDSANVVVYKGGQKTLEHYVDLSPELRHKIGSIKSTQKVFSVAPLTNPMKNIFQGRVVLVGDAAGFLDPLTGEGIFNALWMANTLAQELKEINLNLNISIRNALKKYERKKRRFFNNKNRINHFFQWLIQRPWAVSIVGRFLLRKKNRPNHFIGIIGNIYSPLKGVFKVLFSS